MITDAYIDEVLARLAGDRRVRREFPGGGCLYLDRRLPFLCVYRRAVGEIDDAAERLISTQTAYMIMPGEKAAQRPAGRLLRAIVKAQMEYFQGFLVLEIWFSRDREHVAVVHEESGEPLTPAPWFCVHADKRRRSPETVGALIRSLKRIRILKQPAEVESVTGLGFGPPARGPLLSSKETADIGCHVMGVEIRPIYRDPAGGEVFPDVLRGLRRKLGRTFKQMFFSYARLHTNINPHHFHSLGRRSFVRAVREADCQLAEIESSFDLLLQATPTNVEAAWLEFRRQGFDVAPKFQYRSTTVEPAELKRRLFNVPIGRIEDATLAYLLWEKQDELDRKITMLSDVATPRFLPGSIQVYGRVGASLAELASEIIRDISPHVREKSPRRQLRAEEFADLAREEIRRYQQIDPAFQPGLEIRDDIFSGLLVSQGVLLIGRMLRVPAARVEALLQHEIGTHLLTYHNGSFQPFRQLAMGLAGYGVLQEGLAVLAEHLVGGLERSRLRLLAARVLAVRSLLDGAGFVDTYRLLTRQMGFAKRMAYTITMRVHRGGGLTKDATYLQGLVDILAYLGNHGELEPLLSGKIAASHIPLMEELRLRKILRPPPLRPRYMDYPCYAERILQVHRGMTVIDLIKETRKCD